MQTSCQRLCFCYAFILVTSFFSWRLDFLLGVVVAAALLIYSSTHL